MNQLREGNFTSSEVVALTKSGSRTMTEEELAAYKIENPKGRRTTVDTMFGEAALTYIGECNNERRLGRSIDNESSARPLAWGKVAEKRVFDLLGTSYAETSQETISHPRYPFWVGSPEGTKNEDGIITVPEIKCPFTLGSFCKLVNPLYHGYEGMDAIKAIREGFTDKNGFVHGKHTDAEKYYWQCISNAILTGAKFAELIIYCPYFSELNEVRVLANDMPPEELGNYYWVANSGNDDIPWLKDGGFYKNLNKIRFEIPQVDVDLLTSRVLEASKLLIQI